MPKPTRKGKAVVARVARVKGRKALLRMRCPGTAPCKGRVMLWVNGFRRVLIGKSRFAIPAGKSRTVRVRLTNKGRRLLRRHRLRVQAKGPGLKTRMVLLK